MYTTLLVITGLLGLCLGVLFFMGVFEGIGDTERVKNGWTEAKIIEWSLKLKPVQWHGWYVGYYGTKSLRDTFNNEEIKANRDERRLKAIDRRDERRQQFLSRRGH